MSNSNTLDDLRHLARVGLAECCYHPDDGPGCYAVATMVSQYGNPFCDEHAAPARTSLRDLPNAELIRRLVKAGVLK